jgi:hypothetical protein
METLAVANASELNVAANAALDAWLKLRAENERLRAENTALRDGMNGIIESIAKTMMQVKRTPDAGTEQRAADVSESGAVRVSVRDTVLGKPEHG